MKTIIQSLIQQAILQLQNAGDITVSEIPGINVERTKNPDHGDFATNIALALAKAAKMNPRALAEKLQQKISASDLIAKTEIAGPGFINFFLSQRVFENTLQNILKQQKQYGFQDLGKNKRIHMEFVSSNPTGPLHVGHGRSAAYGACVANLLKAVGYQVHREYYVNDIGRQMRILALSIWLRYLQIFDEEVEIPSNAYQGQYVAAIALVLKNNKGNVYLRKHQQIQQYLAAQNPEEKETYLDAYIAAAVELLTEDDFQYILNVGLENIIADIREDLAEFGVTYEQWFHESELKNTGMLQKGIELLQSHGYTYEAEGALWFRATDFGDEKDRVLVRSNGHTTYFASDVAYHLHKYNEGYDEIIDVFGADHHGYISRIRAFLQGLGKNPEQLKVLLVQFAILYRGKEKVSMSTRSGEFVTLRELRNEVGNDAARYFYIMRKPEQHLDFDLELAKSQSTDNPVYYIQYAHARICSIWRQLTEQAVSFDQDHGMKNLSLLSTSHEKQLQNTLSRYPEMLETAALNYDPHFVAYYLFDLAHDFHTYYNAERFIVDNAALRNARLILLVATKQVLVNGLEILGLSAPEKM